MFPAGAAGIALLILRFCVGAGLVLAAVGFSEPPSPAWQIWLGVPVGILLLLGFLTPLACVITLLARTLFFPLGNKVAMICAISYMLVTLSLLMLGPGAYSIDAKKFGRRVILPRS